jgi:hypothetical protein
MQRADAHVVVVLVLVLMLFVVFGLMLAVPFLAFAKQRDPPAGVSPSTGRQH